MLFGSSGFLQIFLCDLQSAALRSREQYQTALHFEQRFSDELCFRHTSYKSSCLSSPTASGGIIFRITGSIDMVIIKFARHWLYISDARPSNRSGSACTVHNSSLTPSSASLFSSALASFLSLVLQLQGADDGRPLVGSSWTPLQKLTEKNSRRSGAITFAFAAAEGREWICVRPPGSANPELGWRKKTRSSGGSAGGS